MLKFLLIRFLRKLDDYQLEIAIAGACLSACTTTIFLTAVWAGVA